MDKKPYYISTAIAYTSAKPHIGNTYEIVLADAIARYKRMTGYDVYFQTGTDEHGQKIQEKAEAAGITPQQHVDKVAGEVKTIWDLMNTTYDKFIRTTDPMHEKKVQKIFKKLYDQGDIYKGAYKGKYCKPCESFWTESQLKDGCCPDCGRPCVDAEEEAYFFRMSKYADRLMKHIEEHPEFIQPESRKNEMVNNFLKPGLQDLCVSRTSFSWGIPVDFDPGHVVYVWLDALTNYITFCGYDPRGFKLLVWTLSAVLCGLAGALYVPQVGIINPGEMSPTNSIEAAIWVALGGRGTLVGPVIGAALVNGAKSFFTVAMPEYWQLFLGLIFIAVTLFLPRGVFGLFRKGEN